MLTLLCKSNDHTRRKKKTEEEDSVDSSDSECKTVVQVCWHSVLFYYVIVVNPFLQLFFISH